MSTLSEADKAKMRKAQTLIREKRYGEARRLLVDVNDPHAIDWILRIDAILVNAQTEKVVRRQSNFWYWAAGILIIAGIVGAAAYSAHENQVREDERARRAVCNATFLSQSDAWIRCMEQP